MSCSSPTTTTFFAFRPAVVLGTCAHDWANGAACEYAPVARAATWPVAVAEVAITPTVIAAPTRSHRRLCIDFPPFGPAPGVLLTAAPALSHARGRPARRYDDGRVA